MTRGAGDAITSTGTIQINPVDGSRTVSELTTPTAQFPNGTLLVSYYDAAGKQLALPQDTLNNIDTGVSSLYDAYQLIRAVQNHQALPALSSGLRLVNDVTQGTLPGLSQASGPLGVLSGLVGLGQAIERGDVAGAVLGGANLAYSGAALYAQVNNFATLSKALEGNLFGEATGAVQVLGDYVPYAAAFYDLVNGNIKGAVASAAGAYVGAEIGTAIVPVVGTVVGLVVGALLSDLFSDEIEPWGSATFTWGDVRGQMSVSVLGDKAGQGQHVAYDALQEAGSGVSGLVAAFNAANPDAQLGLIANRLGSIDYDDYALRVSTLDPATGNDAYPDLRFERSAPHDVANLTPDDAAYFQRLDQFYTQDALARQAIAPMWEVLTAQLQSEHHLSNAGLSELARAASQGRLAAPLGAGATVHMFNPIGLDLGGGLTTTGLDQSGVQFDVDGAADLNAELLGQHVDHFVKHTAWLNNRDGFLVLDKNINGTIDDGEEMFSNSKVSEKARGIASLQGVDADGNGIIDANDPVFSEMLIWRDANADGHVDSGEATTLASLGISRLNYQLGSFVQNGQTRQMGTLKLQADREGSAYVPTAGGIKITTTDGETTIAVTKVNDLSKVQANADGVTTEQDTPITMLAHGVSGVQGLLDNDHITNAPNALLALTGVANARHGTVSFDAESQSVTFTPDAGYSGNEAGFDYTVGAGAYGQANGHVQVSVGHTDEAPLITGHQNTRIPIYGYTYSVDNETGLATYTPFYRPGVGHPTAGGGVLAYQSQPVDYVTDPYSGTVSAADPDDASSSLTWSLASDAHHGHVKVDARTGAWQFLDPEIIGGEDAFVLKVTDPSGKSDQIQITVPLPAVIGPPGDGGGTGGGDSGPGGASGPVVLDLNGSGFHFTSVGGSNVFLESGDDGWRHRTAWVSGGNGVLAVDKYGDGVIHDSSQIELTRYSGTAQTDLEGLASFDSNHDGKISRLDAQWSQLGVWVDANRDGVSQEGEYRSLEAAGIASLSLASDERFSVDHGVTVHGVTTFTRDDGTIGQAADVTLPYSSDVLFTNPDGTTVIKQVAQADPAAPIIVGDGNNLVMGNAGDNVIQVGDGNNVVMTGSGNDLIATGNGNNTIQTGDGKDVVVLGNGNNTVFLGAGPKLVVGGTGNNLIVGGSGSAQIYGGSGNDIVYAGSGNSLLYGGKGNDALTGGIGHNGLVGGDGDDSLADGGGKADMAGGAGNDTYVVTRNGDTILEKSGEGVDTVKSAIDQVLGANVENLTLTGRAALIGTGNELDNVLIGNGAAAVLFGAAGNDSLADSGGGARLAGGTGADTYVVANAATVVTESSGEGRDTVKTSVSYALADNVEVLIATGNAAVTLTGGSTSGGTLIANDGNDTLVAGAAAVTMVGGKGNVTFVVNHLDDVVQAQAAGNTNTVVSSVSYKAPANVRVLKGGGHAAITLTGNDLGDTIVANDAGNRLVGGRGVDTLQGGVGDDALDGGSGADAMRGGQGDDTYVVDNASDTVVESAGQGIDSVLAGVDYSLGANLENLTLTGTAVRGTGNELNNTLTANDRGNTLLGAAGNDILQGGSGADVLDGGTGAEKMSGRGGDDTYVVDRSDDQVIEDANEGVDGVQAAADYTLGANVENLTLTGTAHQGSGNELDNVLTANDLGDSLSGGSGQDTLYGGAGGDRLDGGGGVDEMRGGDGDDIYFVDNTSDVVVEAANQGIDGVLAGIDYSLGADFENLTLTGAAVSGTGNNQANTITGNDRGDTLSGAGGNDTLQGGAGADFLYGGSGNDIYVVNRSDDQVIEAANEGVDSVQAAADYGLAANVENLTLTGTAHQGTGNDLDNVLTANDLGNSLSGGGGRDTLYGGAGADRLDGGSGIDAMRGGNGDDTYVVDNAGDEVAESAGQGVDSILAGIDYSLGANLENLTLTDTAVRGTGNDTANTITANDHGATLSGAGGDDTLLGGSGADILDGGTGTDRMSGHGGGDSYVVDRSDDQIIEAVNEGVDEVHASADYVLTTNVENLTLTGTARRGTGNELDNVITANDLGNSLSGCSGQDTLYGGAGSDTLDGGSGTDVMRGGAGDDTYVVDAADQFVNDSWSDAEGYVHYGSRLVPGDSTVELADAGTDEVFSSVSWTLGDNVENLTLTGTNALSAYGNALDNRIRGNTGSNTMDGDSGNDDLDGASGSDHIIGGQGNDRLYGGDDASAAAAPYGGSAGYGGSPSYGGYGDSPSYGGYGGTGQALIDNNDYLDGGAGDDVIDGGSGNDMLYGGEGNDLLLGGADLNGLPPVSPTGAGWSILPNNDYLDGGSGTDVMRGGSGNDTYVVDRSDDQVTESANEGVDGVQAAADYTLGANVENLTLTGMALQGIGNDLDNLLTANNLGNSLSGGAGRDVVYGGAGNDRLDGGAGGDVMIGGAGDDTYIVDSASDTVVENAGQGIDSVLAGIDYSLGANLENLTLTGTAVRGTGNDQANTITGNDRGDTLSGAGGNDTLQGGAGADLLSGGSGNDTYVLNRSDDQVIEAANEGVDSVQASADYGLGANVENLTLTGTAHQGIGNDLDNVLTANDLGNSLSGGGGRDTLYGGAGADRLDGGSGTDTMRGGNGDDTYVVDDASDAVVEAANQGMDGVLAGSDYVLGANVENLTLTGTARQGTGNGLDNVITANDMGDSLSGGGGQDSLYGGAGNDRLDGGTGADDLRGGAGNDRYGYSRGDGDDRITDLQGSNVLEFGTRIAKDDLHFHLQGDDMVIDVVARDGYPAGSITLVGWSGAHERLDRIYFGDTGQSLTLDESVLNTAPTARDDVSTLDEDERQSSGNVLANDTDPDAGDHLSVANAGSFTGAYGTLALSADGSYTYTLDNQRGEVQSLASGQQLVDTFSVSIRDAGTPALAAASQLRLTITGANDAPVLASALVDVQAKVRRELALDLPMGTFTDVDQTDTLAWSARLAGGGELPAWMSFDPVYRRLSGTPARELDGAVYDIEMSATDSHGAKASDTFRLTLDAVGSTLVGTAAADSLTGTDLDDTLDGRASADTMAGDAGNDSYVVDDAGDQIVEAAGNGFDRVSASIDYVLPQNAEQLTLTGNARSGGGNGLDNLLFGNASANILDGGAGADQMAGGLGDDRYAVDNPADSIVEAADGGIDTVVASVSTTLASSVENLVLAGSNPTEGTGNELDNVLVGNTAGNRLVGGAGADVLDGGVGDDAVDGGGGDDLYLYNQGEGRDIVTDSGGADVLRFGAGVTLDSIVARSFVTAGEQRIFLSLVTPDGTEQSSQGVELAATGGIERIEFGNGTSVNLTDFMVTTRTLEGDAQNNTITGDRRDETINANGGNDTVYARTGNDVAYGGDGVDRLFGEGGNDELHGDEGNDELWGGAGVDVLDGGNGSDQLLGASGDDLLLGGTGNDVLDGGAGNDVLNGGIGEDQLFAGAGDDTLKGGGASTLLAGGEGNDVISSVGQGVVIAGAGNDSVSTAGESDFIDAGSGDDSISTRGGSDFIAGGRGKDTIDTGTEQDVLAFNSGDGTDTVIVNALDHDTVSLGGGIRYADLSLRKSGNDLVLDVGPGDSMTFQGWYTSNARRSVDTLQMVTTGADYNAASSDRMKNRKVVSFDFRQLVNRFDEVRAANPALTSWAIARPLDTYFLASSDTQAIGGDLANRYATTGSYGDLDWTGVRNRMSGMSGATWQTLAASTAVDPWTALQAGVSLIADATAGLPSPIVPTPAPGSDELAFAAMTASGHKPSWMGDHPAAVMP